MKLSAKTRYAARILLDLARNGRGAPLAATRLSQHTGVSVQFIEQILKPLKQAGLTASTRGASGGHSLAKEPRDISLGQLVRIMEGGINITMCSSEEYEFCESQHSCPTREAWARVSRSLERELDAITVQDLLDGYQALDKEGKGDCFPVCRSASSRKKKAVAFEGGATPREEAGDGNVRVKRAAKK